jgi:hypothetical protein
MKDANRLVLYPIERICEKLKIIAQNPQAAVNEEQDSEALQMLEMVHGNISQSKLLDKGPKKKPVKQDTTLETAILEQAITKISHLLALGFGEAGSAIIAQNMNTGGDLNPMLPGQRIQAIYGFCDIRNFTDCTEILQQKVFVFVNQIAEITHS